MKKDGFLMETKTIGFYANVYRQGDRIVYRTSFSFEQVADLIKPTEIRDDSNEPILDRLDHIENRFLNKSHANGIKAYIKENPHNFILPSLTLLTTKRFSLEPISPSWETLNEICNEKITSIQLRDSLTSILDKCNGSMLAYVKIPTKYFSEVEDFQKTITIGDGNHRARMIIDLKNDNEVDVSKMHIGVDFYVEPDAKERKKVFVALNTSLSVEKSAKSFLMVDDVLSSATKDLIGFKHTTFLVKQFNPRDKEKFIGVEPLDNVGARSKDTISFNILKNMISILGVGNTSSDKFSKRYPFKSTEYRKLLSLIQKYLEEVFDNVTPYKRVQGNLDAIPELRKNYLSLSGAGLYLIAYVGYEAQKNDYDLIKVARILGNIDWSREVHSEPNALFIGGILNSTGNVSNTRSALKPNVERLMKIVNDEINKY